MLAAVEIHVEAGSDAYQIRRDARGMAISIGFGSTESEEIALAVSELATNLLRYARHGVIALAELEIDCRRGMVVQSCDAGPGIADVAEAMVEGFSTDGGLGGGLPGVRRLMDEFHMDSSATGTTIIAHKWLKTRSQ